MFQDIKPPKKSGRKAPDHNSLSQLGWRALDGARHQAEKPLKPLHKKEEIIELPDEPEPKPDKGGHWHLVLWWKHLGRNTRFGIISLALLFFFAGSIGYYYFTRPVSEASLIIVKHPKPVVTTVASPLTGVQVAPELAKRPVTGIMVENSLDARPQSGIQDAGVVFEAIAEGGITRFLTLYQDSNPQYIGPVRSLRPYYIDWAGSFDASIAHVGGSPEALSQIRSSGKDLDQFFNSGSYWRQSTRAAPHNVYTSFERLDALNARKGYTSSNFTPWARKKDKPLAVPTAKSININISSFYFNSHYDYDAASNSYLRSEGGKPHTVTVSASDGAGQQLHPKVLIALTMSYGLEPDDHHSAYGTIGSGQMYVFQDGGVTQGTWSKANRAAQFTFVDSAGVPIKFNAGQAWVVAVAKPSMVTYAP